MRNLMLLIFLVSIIVLFACNPASEPLEQFEHPVFELNSLSFIDSLGGLPEADLLQLFKEVNTIVVDSLGYPGAGYTIWKVQADTVPYMRYLIRGNWPNMDTYKIIHDHPLYKETIEKVFSGIESLKTNMYRRYELLN
jgi:hypothetical protein